MALRPIVLGGAPEGYDAWLLARELSRGKPVIHVARDDKRAEAMRAGRIAEKVAADLERLAPAGAASAARARAQAAIADWCGSPEPTAPAA